MKKKCCNESMDLISVSHNINGDVLYFQCSRCGDIQIVSLDLSSLKYIDIRIIKNKFGDLE